jgi:putative NADH-flavin reductase
MNLALIGASGFVGSKLCMEAIERGHHITAISRNPTGLAQHPRVQARSCNVHDVDRLAGLLSGHDAVINSFSPGHGVLGPQAFTAEVAGATAVIAATKRSGVRRLLTVGGAASLKAKSGVEFLDSDEWPAEFEPFRDAVRGTRELYYLLKTEQELDWVFLSPSVWLRPGERTGKYRVGTDHVLYDADGVSRISLEDYAVAMLDEVERPKHHRQRFTVGY